MFAYFRRDLAPGIRLTKNARAYLDTVEFRDIFVFGMPPGFVVDIDASAIVAYSGAILSLVVRSQTS